MPKPSKPEAYRELTELLRARRAAPSLEDRAVVDARIETRFRRKLLRRLAPGGGQAPVPDGRFALSTERWLQFLAGLAEGARDADAREAIAGAYAPWRGFCIDLCRAVEEEREALSEREARQLPAPSWFEPLRRLDAAAFPDTAHDFAAHVHDRQLLERDEDGDEG